MAAERKEKVIRVLQILQTTDKKTPVNATHVKNFMSCHSLAFAYCHKLTHFPVTVSGALAPDFLLYSTDHLMVCYKTHHVLIY